MQGPPELIDLDIAPRLPTYGDPASGRYWIARGSAVLRRHPVLSRLLLALLAAALLAGTLSTAASPALRRFPAQVEVVADGRMEFALADNGLYLSSGARSRLSRYAMDGRLIWSMPVPNVYTATLLTVGSVVLVGTDSWPGETFALDRDTGRLLWRTRGRVVATTSSTAVLNGNGPDARPDDNGLRLTAVALADAHPVWRQDLEPSEREQLVRAVSDGRGGYVVTGAGLVDAEGLGVFIDLASGAGRTLAGFPVSVGGNDRSIARFGPVLLALGPGRQTASTLRAFAVDTFRQVWSIETDGHSWGNTCGPYLCVPDGDGTRALDPATGELRWQADWMQVRAGSQGRRAIAFSAAGSGKPGRSGVLDVRTGRTLRTFPGWRTTELVGDRWTPLLREVNGDHWEVATLDLERLTAYRLGEFPTAWAGRCQVSDSYVACPVHDLKIGIWRYAA